MTTLPAPGAYDMPMELYQELPALSAGGVWDLDQKCPLKFWWNSPFNPEREREEKTIFNIGTAAHLAILEPDHFADRVAVIRVTKKDGNLADDYRTDAAKAARDEAYAAGKTPLFETQVEQVMALRKAILSHPLAATAFADGKPEETLIWRDSETGVPCKARVDWRVNDCRHLVDLKTVHTANPRHLRRASAEQGYYSRAAWYLEGAEIVYGKRPSVYWFVAVEREPPYIVSVFDIDTRDLEKGVLVNRAARSLFRACMERGEWPPYREPDHPDKDRAFTIRIPDFAEFQFAERYENGEFRATVNDTAKRAAFDMQRPL